MDLPDENEQRGSEWSDLTPSTTDKHQDYVFFAHVILAIIISVLSFPNGWGGWVASTGIMSPVLLIITGVAYGLSPGINWYRDEFIPHICKTRTLPEFETDRFLNYKRMYRRTIPLAGYLSTVITQYLWSFVAFLTLSINPGLGDAFILLSLIFGLMVCLYFVFLLIWLTFFEYLWNAVYSDASQIMEVENEMREYYESLKNLETDTEST